MISCVDVICSCVASVPLGVLCIAARSHYCSRFRSLYSSRVIYSYYKLRVPPSDV
jgi:hypothetical protein